MTQQQYLGRMTAFDGAFVGGVEGATGSYETDYWLSSYREAVEWVAAVIPPTTRVRNTSQIVWARAITT